MDKYRLCDNCLHEGDRTLQICDKARVRKRMREGGHHCIDHDFRPNWEKGETVSEGITS